MKSKFIILLFIYLIQGACCTKKDCINAFELNEIKLSGYTLNKEYVFVAAYMKSESYKTLIDSATILLNDYYTTNIDGTVTFILPINLNANADYYFEFMNSKKTYKITSISTASKKCNSCFLSEDKYTVLSSYKVNDEEFSKSYFEISFNNSK